MFPFTDCLEVSIPEHLKDKRPSAQHDVTDERLTQRVGHVEEHSTLTTDVLSVCPRAVNTGCSLHGGGVCATGQLGLPAATQ